MAVKSPLPVSVPPASSKFAALTLPLMLTVPPLTTWATPAPLKVVPLWRLCVVLEKTSRAPRDVLKLPLLVPPPASWSVPLCTSTIPLLLKGTPPSNLVVVPLPDLLNVPALSKAWAPDE